MGLKVKVDEFLQSVKAMRENAIIEASQQALQTKHEPFKAQMTTAKEKALAVEEREFQKMIEQITAQHNAKVAEIKADFEGEIVKHRTIVARDAEAIAKVEYDKFILGVCAVADDIKIN